MAWRRVALGLGSSLGARAQTLELAVRRLQVQPGIDVRRVSHWVRTPPMTGGHARNWFLNGVAVLQTAWDAHDLLDLCVSLERQAGRRRRLFWGDRPLDLDVLLVESEVVQTARLAVPHPGIAERRFVLEPLLEVWPDAVDPETGRPFAEAVRAPGPLPARYGMLALSRPLRYL